MFHKIFKTAGQAIKFLKDAKSKFKQNGQIKTCFHYNPKECRYPIKSAHSLQKNGVLSLVEYEVNGNNVVFCFDRMTTNPFGQYTGFEAIGKKSASTFFGFCDKHDTDIFEPIENKELDIESEHHKFLLCYRALAKEYHRKSEQKKSFENTPNDGIDLNFGKEGSQIAVEELEIHKSKLNEILSKNRSDGFRHFSHTLEYSIPVACSTVTSPKFFISSEIFNYSEDKDYVFQFFYLTIVPTKTRTHILYSCLPEDLKSMRYIDDLESLESETLEIVTSSILAMDVENTFISPYLFALLNEYEQTKLIEAIELSDKMRYGMPGFYNLGINLFNEKYKKNQK